MDAAFYDAVRSSLFGGKLTQAQVDTLDTIGAAWARHGDGDKAKLAYILGTAFHESGRFKYLREIWGPTAAQKGYEGRADLGNVIKGDGKRFMGRGLVQITGRRNYLDWSDRLGIDLAGQPDLAERLDIAARVLVEGMMLGTFTGKKLADYIKPDSANFINARRTVNGTDKADLIAGYGRKFYIALGDRVVAAPQPTPPPSAKPQSKTLMDWLKGLFIKQAVNHVAHQLKDTPIMNSNLFHNILNVAIALLAGVTAFLLATGCSQLVTGALDCSASWVDPVWTTGITAALGALKTIINIARDGFGGLFKSQPPVK